MRSSRSYESNFDSSPLLIDTTMTLQKYIDENLSKRIPPRTHGLPKRYIFAVLAFLGMASLHAMRVNLSVTILAMVNNTVEEQSRKDSSEKAECPELIENVTLNNKLTPIQVDLYNWTEATVNRILGSFFYGYVLTQIPGGYFAEQISGKWLFGGGVFITALLTTATPLTAKWGEYGLITTRVVEGLAQGVTHSSINSMISRWSPKFERSRVSSFIFSGGIIGIVYALPVSAWMSSSRVFGGWPSVFYGFGISSIIWFLFWSQLVYDSPVQHPMISEYELLYFEENQETIHKDGNVCALPFLSEAFGAWISSYVADRMREENKQPITIIRKIFNTIGTLGPAMMLFCITLAGCRPKLIVALVCLTMALHGFSFSGFQVTHIDMSPDFAGVLFGISSSIADLNGIIGPTLVTAFTYKETAAGAWNKVFYVMCSGYSIAGIVYLLFSSAELQPWGLDKKAISIKESFSKEINIAMKEWK